MGVGRVNPGGWPVGALLTSAQANALDTNVSDESDRLDDVDAAYQAADTALAAADDALDAAKVTAGVARYTINSPTTYNIDDPMALTLDQADTGYVLSGGDTIQVPAKGWYLVTFSMLVSLSSASDGAAAEAWIKVGGTTKLRSSAKRPGASGNVGLASSCPIWVETPATDTIQLIARHGTGTQSVIAATQANLGLIRIGAPA